MTEKNPFDMNEKAFQKYLSNFKQPKTISEIAAGKNVSSVRFQDEPKGISPQKWSETDIAKDFYKEYSDRDTVKKAHGGSVKKYAKGGDVKKNLSKFKYNKDRAWSGSFDKSGKWIPHKPIKPAKPKKQWSGSFDKSGKWIPHEIKPSDILPLKKNYANSVRKVRR